MSLEVPWLSLEVPKKGTSSGITDSKKVLPMVIIRDWQFQGTASPSGQKNQCIKRAVYTMFLMERYKEGNPIRKVDNSFYSRRILIHFKDWTRGQTRTNAGEDKQTDTLTDTQTDRLTDRWHKNKQTYRYIVIRTTEETSRQTDREIKFLIYR